MTTRLVNSLTSLSLLATLILTSGCGAIGRYPGPDERQTVEGFSTPESALHDTVADRYLVSNIHGSPFGDDGKGFISRMHPDGTIETLKWIDGSQEGVELNAPKGMALVGEVLYVTDVTSVRKFDRATGRPLGSIAIEGATFLNDAHSPAGTQDVYVSDTGFGPGFQPSGSDAIYKIDANDTVTTVAKGSDLGNPNGIHSRGKDLLVVTWTTGKLLQIGEDGKVTELQTLPAGQLDGIELLRDGHYAISSWEGACIFKTLPPTRKAITKVAEEIEAPADIGYDATRGVILLPYFNGGKMELIPE